jgi:hypothetical protein
MGMTKEQAFWQYDLLQLESQGYGTVRLICDEHNVSVQIRRSANRLVLQWFIDGSYSGIYTDKDNPIGQKFGRPHKVHLPAKLNLLYKRFDGKKEVDKKKEEYNKQILGFHMSWLSAKSFINHIKKTCTKIELAP